MAKQGTFAPGLSRVSDSVKSASKPSMRTLARNAPSYHGAVVPNIRARELNSSRNSMVRVVEEKGRRR